MPTSTEAMSQAADPTQWADDRDPGRDGRPSLGSLSPVRLFLLPSGTGPRRIDGVWWPYSCDLSRELPSLLAALDRQRGRVTRVTVNRSAWPHVPPRLRFVDRVVHLGCFRTDRGPQAICLICPGVGRWDLTVVPPGMALPEAELLMAGASGVRTPHTSEA